MGSCTTSNRIAAGHYEEKMLKLPVYDVKMSKMTEMDQAQSTRLIEQLATAPTRPGVGTLPRAM